MIEKTESSNHFVMIGLVVLLMASVVYLVGTALWQDRQAHTAPEGFALRARGSVPVTALEPWKSARQETSVRFPAAPPVSVRTLTTYYERRAYPGAPPTIPHTVKLDMAEAGNSCLQCHAQGDYVTKFSAYSPVTPHPEMTNCRQCHVPQQDASVFRAVDWHSVRPPTLGRTVLPGGPPPIPHALQMRENCLACHSGPAAIREIRSGHPERLQCRQCHVPAWPSRTQGK